MSELKMKIITPSVPNFIRVEFGSGGYQMLPLTDFDDELLDALAKDWRFKLYENQERQKKNRETGE